MRQIKNAAGYATRPATVYLKLQIHFTTTYHHVKAIFIRLAAWLSFIGV
jgi:hypothetical protein